MQYHQINLDHVEPDRSPLFRSNVITPLSSTPLRLVFLDVDGVLNTANERMATSINQDCLELFCATVKEANAYIVVSSTWRKHKPFMEKLLHCLGKGVDECDIGSRVLGKTPDIAAFERPREILSWLRDFRNMFPHHQVLSWVCVDDMPLEEMGGDKFEDHCVKTTITRGFEPKHSTELYGKLTQRSSPVSVVGFL